jgi:hypothetical protein
MNTSKWKKVKRLLPFVFVLWLVADFAMALDRLPPKKFITAETTSADIDTDGDGIKDKDDSDDDNDGVVDSRDAFPLDPTKTKSPAFCFKSSRNIHLVCSEGIKGCRDSYIPDPRCLRAVKESEESKKTLLGTDADGDGIRDDIESAIDTQFTGTIRTQTREMAKSYQKVLSGTLNNKQINEQVAEIERLNACIRNTTADNADTGHRFITHKQLNTVDRTRTYLKRAAEAYDAEGSPTFKDCDNSNSKKTRHKRKSNSEDLDIYFINGVRNSEEDAEDTKDKLEEVLDKSLEDPLYNKNNLLGQFFDVYVEKTGEVNVDKSGTGGFWNFIYRSIPPQGKMLLTLPQWLDPGRDIGYSAEKDLEKMIKQTKESLENDKKVIVVPHSEGNFFYRKIHQALNEWDSKKTEQCFAGVGFAPPLSSKFGNYEYITNSNDKVINLVRGFWNSTLAANITVPEGYNGDGSGHGMLETYLSHSIPVDRLKSEFKQAEDKLDKSCKSCAEYVAKTGQQGEHQYTYPLSNNSVRQIEISFEAYNIPDRLKITANGETIVETGGLVSGFNQWQVDYDPKKHGTEFIAHVDAPTDGTKWKLCIDCEGSFCEDHIKRKDVYYNFRADGYWKCENHKIDGWSVSSSGTKRLSIGRHWFSADCYCTHQSTSGNPGPCNYQRGFASLIVKGTACESTEYPNCVLDPYSSNFVLEIK